MHKYLNPFTGVFRESWSSFWNIQYKIALIGYPISFLIIYLHTNQIPYPAIFVWTYAITLINSYIYFEKKGQ